MKKPETILTSDILKIMSVLKNKAYLIGGAVRDFLTNHPIEDIDMATSLPPEQSITLLKENGYRVIPSGLKYGTITILSPLGAIELTTFREDIETDGRHARVVFSTEMKKDAIRRDFTINALYMDSQGNIYDFFHGLKDLKESRIRFIGEPEERIKEDALRILRFFRFWGQYSGKKIPLRELKACRKTACLLDRLSSERKKKELFKILALPRAPQTLQLMRKYKILQRLLNTPSSFKTLARFVNLEKKRNRSFGVLPRLFLILKDPFSLPDLTLSNKEKKELESLRKLAKTDLSSYSKRRKAAYFFTPALVEKALYIQQAQLNRPISFAQSQELHHLTAPKFPITAADFTRQGFLAGPELGRKIKEAETIWIKMNFPEKKELVLEKLKR